MPDYSTELYIHKKMKTNEETSKNVLSEILPVIEGITDWTQDVLHDELMALVERLGIKNGQLLYPLRIALSGKAVTPGGGIELAVILGKDETLKRLKKSIEKLKEAA